MQAGNLVEVNAVAPAELLRLIDPAKCTLVRVRESSVLFRPLLQFVSRTAQNSFEIDQAVCGQKKKGAHPLTVSGMLTNDPAMSTQLVAGFGIHPVVWEGETLFVCYQRVGHVVGTYSDAVLMEEFCVYANGLKKQDLLHRFCEHVYNEANKNEDNDTFRIYSWVIEEGWWKTSSVRSKRPMESVVLPDTTKETILNDLDSFLDDKTETWYRKHGIVYKRSYLLYGPPGTGKTSFLSAIASKYDRNLCFLQAGHPNLTDACLHSALNQMPEGSILVLEDIDSLFTVDRKSDSKSPLTFSGLLNALDGLASPAGAIIVLTSNHPERLDPALLRHGRVDLKCEFPHATEKQVADLFRSFYPDCSVEAAVKFSKSFEPGKMNLAALQDFFIQNRERTWSEAADRVSAWIKQQGDAEQAIKDFEAKNLAKESIKTVDEDEEEESVKVGANAIEEKKKQKQKNQITMPAIYFGFAVAAAFLLLKAHKKE